MSTISLNRILFTHLRGDLTGGVTAAVVALPLALAFGVGSGCRALRRHLRRAFRCTVWQHRDTDLGPHRIGAILIIMQLDPLLGFEIPANVQNALTVLPE